MRSQDTLAETGVGGRLNWLVGGGVGGLAGALIFGGVLWTIDPETVTEGIPQLYGVEGGGLAGWGFHLAHGLVLGVVFGFVVTREPVMGTITADVATPVLDRLSPAVRFVFAGIVYGLALWVVLPGVLLSILTTFGGTTDPFPWASVYSLLGHLLYGALLGALVSVTVDFETEAVEADAPFEEEHAREDDQRS